MCVIAKCLTENKQPVAAAKLDGYACEVCRVLIGQTVCMHSMQIIYLSWVNSIRSGPLVWR
jgi:hypothetical protein